MPLNLKKPLQVILSCATVLILFTIPFLILRSRTWPLIWDAAVSHYVAWLITEGFVPYRDIFDVQFPGTYIIHLLVINILGSGDLQWRIFDLLCLIVIDLFIYLYCNPFGKLASWLGIALFSAFHLYNGPMYIGQRDYILLSLLLGALYFTAKHLEEVRNIKFLAMGGLLLGAAAFIKPYIGLLWIFLFFVIVLHSLRFRLHCIRNCFVFIVFSSIIPIALLAWLQSVGGLQAFLSILFNYLFPLYSKLTFQAFTASNLSIFSGMPLFEIIITAVIAFLNIFSADKTRYRRLLLLIGMAYGFLHFYLQVRNSYQLYPMFLCTFLIISSWTYNLTCKTSPVFKYVMIVILIHVSFLTLYKSTKNLISAPPTHIQKFACKETLVSDLQGRVAPSETVQVMDTMSGALHALYTLKYKQPTRFLFDGHFFHDIEHPFIQNLRKEFLDSLKNNPPKFIVVTKTSWPLPGYERLREFPEFEKWLLGKYTIDVEKKYYRLYQFKPPLS